MTPVLACGTLFSPPGSCPSREALVTQGPVSPSLAAWFLGRSTSSFLLTLQELLIKLIVPSAP